MFTEKDFPQGAESFYRKSLLYDITGGQVNEFSEVFAVATWIYGGEYSFEGIPADGDYIEFTITDEDNLLGYGAGFVLAKYVETEYISLSKKYSEINSEGGKQVPAGFYYTVRYVSVGVSPTNDGKLIVRYNMRKL